MKKFVSLLMALLLVCSLAAPAFADTIEEGDPGDIQVTYTTSESYTVTIPATQNFSASALSSTGTVSASGVMLAAGKKLVVTMTSANNFALKYDSSSIAYTVTLAGSSSALSGAAGTAYEILSVSAGTLSGSKSLTFATTVAAVNAATLAGNHTDTLTFSCEVK